MKCPQGGKHKFNDKSKGFMSCSKCGLYEYMYKELKKNERKTN